MDPRFRQALQAYRSGDLALAEKRCRDALRRAPRDPAALHLMGRIGLSAGNAAAALPHLLEAAAGDAGNAQIQSDLGYAALSAGDVARARAALRSAITLSPQGPDVWCWLGMALVGLGNYTEAESAFSTAIAADPANPGLLMNRGSALLRLDRYDEALDCIERAAAIEPGNAMVRAALGAALLSAGRNADAKAACEKAIAIDPGCAEAHNTLGNCLAREGDEPSAMEHYRCALNARPDYPDACFNLANLLKVRQEYGQAAALYRKMLASDERNAVAHRNLASTLLELRDLAGARLHAERAAVLEPDSPDNVCALGALLHEEGRLKDEIALYRKAMSSAAEASPDVRYNLGLALLFAREFETAWTHFDQRFACAEWRSSARPGSPAGLDLFDRIPRWRGPAESRGPVAILAEQGIGDQILFATMIPELVNAGVDFVYEIDPRLLPAFRRTYPSQRFVAVDSPPNAACRDAGQAVAAGSVPGFFRRSTAAFSRQPARLLAADAGRTRDFAGRLAAMGRHRKVALSWRSSRRDRVSGLKNASLAAFAPLLQLAGAEFIDVQYGDTAAERQGVADVSGTRMHRFDDLDHTNDLDGLLALLAACDLVITTSNATAHLAGAVGKRTWLLLRPGLPPFHYWTRGDGELHSLWYPSVAVVQPAGCEGWHDVAVHAAGLLAEELG